MQRQINELSDMHRQRLQEVFRPELESVGLLCVTRHPFHDTPTTDEISAFADMLACSKANIVAPLSSAMASSSVLCQFFLTATRSGVSPAESFLKGLAPAASSSLTIAASPCLAASCRGYRT